MTNFKILCLKLILDIVFFVKKLLEYSIYVTKQIVKIFLLYKFYEMHVIDNHF